MAHVWLRHALHAASILVAYVAMLAVFDQAWETLYGWLGLALILQGVDDAVSFSNSDNHDVDAPHARTDPGYVVWFLTTVFVPVIALLHAGFLDNIAGTLVAGLILLGAFYRFAFQATDRRSGSFMGLPAAWAVVAFLLHAFDATPVAAVLTIGVVLVLNLIPIPWPHPFLAERWQMPTRAVAAIWLFAAAATLWRGFPAEHWAKVIFIGCGVYAVIWVITALREGNQTTR
jgi:phosphatidylcholine synthase